MVWLRRAAPMDTLEGARDEVVVQVLQAQLEAQWECPHVGLLQEWWPCACGGLRSAAPMAGRVAARLIRLPVAVLCSAGRGTAWRKVPHPWRVAASMLLDKIGVCGGVL